MITLAHRTTHLQLSSSRKAFALVALLALSGSALAGCGAANDDTASASPSVPSSAVTGAPESGSPAPGMPASSSASASASDPASAPASSPAATGDAQAGVGACSADMLTGSVEDIPGGADAGGVSRALVLTNSSADSTCILAGYPGVSYLDAAGQQVGAPAARTEGGGTAPVTLAPQQSAAAELRETVAQKYGECQVSPTASLRVYPPEDTASLTFDYASTGCLNSDIELLHVGPLQAR